MRLYELEEEEEAIEIFMDEWAAEHDGDITDFPLNDEMKFLEEERDKKLLNVGVWIKDLLADAAKFKTEIATLQWRKRVMENKAEKLKGFISYHLKDGEKLKDSRCDIGWRLSAQLILDVPVEALPPEYIRTKIEPDKTSLKNLVKIENDCTYAHLEENYNLQIK